jgi:hypothetical protein
MPVAISDENRPIKLSVLAFLVAIVLVFILAALAYGFFTILGLSEAVSGGLASPFVGLIVPLHQQIEKWLYVRRGISTARLNTPTRSTLRMFAYTALIVFGFTVSVALLGAALSAVTLRLTEKASLDIVLGVAGNLIDLAVPVASYLIGEWIGRSLARLRNALLVTVGAPLIAITLSFGLMYFLIGARKETIEASQSGLTKQLQDELVINTPLALLSVIIPMVVGGFRGAKHKPFYDLAFISERLPHQKQEEIQDFVRMIRQEYATTSEPRPS